MESDNRIKAIFEVINLFDRYRQAPAEEIDSFAVQITPEIFDKAQKSIYSLMENGWYEQC